MLELTDICFTRDNKKILDNVSLNLDSDKFIVITGPNGSGKSTLAKIIMGIEKQDSGKILLNGKDILPINLAWTILLAIFIKEVNKFKGNEITEEQLDKVVTATVNKALEIYKKPGRITLKEDLNRILEILNIEVE